MGIGFEHLWILYIWYLEIGTWRSIHLAIGWSTWWADGERIELEWDTIGGEADGQTFYVFWGCHRIWVVVCVFGIWDSVLESSVGFCANLLFELRRCVVIFFLCQFLGKYCMWFCPIVEESITEGSHLC